jgi:hypothetical protein
MSKQDAQIQTVWEYEIVPDAEERLLKAFEMLLGDMQITAVEKDPI